MMILFDNGTPRGLARFLTGHTVEDAGQGVVRKALEANHEDCD
jgi:hypothetical protein